VGRPNECSISVTTKDFRFIARHRESRRPAIGQLNDRGVLGLAELDAKLNELIERAKVSMRAHFRARDIERARSLVEEWRSEQTYPYQGEPKVPSKSSNVRCSRSSL
jgi:hypothetical protein